MTFVPIMFMFIHSSSSENGRKTTGPGVLATFSCNFDFDSWISPDIFRYKAS